ncbi:MAG: hypothetical protein RL000_307 [Bacteroidota bacterium]|jgi:hypothetical protein
MSNVQNMKTFFTLFTCLLIFVNAQAQRQRPDMDARVAELKKIQAMELAFITKELNLNPQEAQKFWPIFNQYRNDLKQAAQAKEYKDNLDRQQKMLDVRKQYRDDFEKVISIERANKVFGAEDEFKSLVRREFQKRQAEKKQLESRKKGF